MGFFGAAVRVRAVACAGAWRGSGAAVLGLARIAATRQRQAGGRQAGQGALGPWGAGQQRQAGGAGALRRAGRGGGAWVARRFVGFFRRFVGCPGFKCPAVPVRPAVLNAPAPPVSRFSAAPLFPPKAQSPLPSLPAACQPFFCRVFWLLCRQALRARVPRPLRAPSAPRPAVLAAPKKPMPSSLHRKPRNRSPLPLLSAGARAPLSSPLRCDPWPLLGVFRVAGSGSLGGVVWCLQSGVCSVQPGASLGGVVWCLQSGVCSCCMSSAEWCLQSGVCSCCISSAEWCLQLLALHAFERID